LGENSPNLAIAYFGQFFNITDVSHTIVLHFLNAYIMKTSDKKLLDYNLGDFFYKHIWSPCTRRRMCEMDEIFAVELLAVELLAVKLFAVKILAVELLAAKLLAVEHLAVELLAVELLAVELLAVELLAVELLTVELLAVELLAVKLQTYVVPFAGVSDQPWRGQPQVTGNDATPEAGKKEAGARFSALNPGVNPTITTYVQHHRSKSLQHNTCIRIL
jgi:hypothetical protein